MIPFSTTTIDIYTVSTKPYEQETSTLVESDLRAVFEFPAGSEERDGQRTENRVTVYCDPTDNLTETGYIIDNNTGERYEINYVNRNYVNGVVEPLSHCQIGAKKISGSVSSGSGGF